MLTPQIIVYVQAQLVQGVGEAKIASDLSAAGWSSIDIAEVFAELHGSVAVPPPPPASASGSSFVQPAATMLGKASSSKSGMTNTKYSVFLCGTGVAVFLVGMGIGYVYSLHPILAYFFSK